MKVALLSALLGVLGAAVPAAADGVTDLGGTVSEFKRKDRFRKYHKSVVRSPEMCYEWCLDLKDQRTNEPICTGIKWRTGAKKPCRIFKGEQKGPCGNPHQEAPTKRDKCYDVEAPVVVEECADGIQSDYRGSISVAAGGQECQNWSELDFPYPEVFPDAGLEGNACRNPVDHPDGAWCYCVGCPNDWGSCDVPTCES